MRSVIILKQNFTQSCSLRPLSIFVKQISSNKEYIEDITWWREDMNFMFEWQEQYLTSERSERVRYCSCREKPIQQKQKAGIVTSLNDTTLTKVK